MASAPRGRHGGGVGLFPGNTQAPRSGNEAVGRGKRPQGTPVDGPSKPKPGHAKPENQTFRAPRRR